MHQEPEKASLGISLRYADWSLTSGSIGALTTIKSLKFPLKKRRVAWSPPRASLSDFFGLRRRRRVCETMALDK